MKKLKSLEEVLVTAIVALSMEPIDAVTSKHEREKGVGLVMIAGSSVGRVSGALEGAVSYQLSLLSQGPQPYGGSQSCFTPLFLRGPGHPQGFPHPAAFSIIWSSLEHFQVFFSSFAVFSITFSGSLIGLM
jgi:hypothetical protein